MAATPSLAFQTRFGVWALVAVTLVAAVKALKRLLDTPSRPYAGAEEGVGAEYDSWTTDGVLEHYWGEHIHLGYYSESERRVGYKKKDFKKAKVDFVDEMLRWTRVRSDQSVCVRAVLDVGCGIGGTSRILARKFPQAQVTGITLSKEQAERAQRLAKEQHLSNLTFVVMDALHMSFEDDTFDLVWACESGEHMPDKSRYISEMTRVLKPHGRLAVATWCQRETPPDFSSEDRSALQYLYDEWSHPHFVSYQEYVRLMEKTGQLRGIFGADWTEQTICSWRHSIWVGIWSPWRVILGGLTLRPGPMLWYKVLREIVCIERMHRAFARGLMQYGMIQGTKIPTAT